MRNTKYFLSPEYFQLDAEARYAHNWFCQQALATAFKANVEFDAVIAGHGSLDRFAGLTTAAGQMIGRGTDAEICPDITCPSLSYLELSNH